MPPYFVCTYWRSRSSRLERKTVNAQVKASSMPWRKCFLYDVHDWTQLNCCPALYSKVNLIAMRMGPGKHLKGLELLNGLVKPEQVCWSKPSELSLNLHSLFKTIVWLFPWSTHLRLSCSWTRISIEFHLTIITRSLLLLDDHHSRICPSRYAWLRRWYHTDSFWDYETPHWSSYALGLLSGCVIGLPPVLNFGSEELKNKVVPEVLSGQKLICLAISEAFAGSDVAGLKCSAKKTEDGKFWIINASQLCSWISVGSQSYSHQLLPPGNKEVDHKRNVSLWFRLLELDIFWWSFLFYSFAH